MARSRLKSPAPFTNPAGSCVNRRDNRPEMGLKHSMAIQVGIASEQQRQTTI
jgi:hypothetical protein